MYRHKGVILFDGECNLCSKSVQFIIKRDVTSYFSFTSLQSETGQILLKKHGIPSEMDSFVFIEGQYAYTESDAAIHVSKHLNGLWKLLYVFKLIPRPIRNFLYSVISRNRYKWWGKSNSCLIATEETKRRFI